jgi:hypothetical protein
MRFTALLTFSIAVGITAVPVFAQEDLCATFTWNVSHERQLFATAPIALMAGARYAAAPPVQAEKLYDLQLGLQTQVAFARPPGKSKPTDGPYAGLAALRVTRAGNYRISLDQPAWIDVITDAAANGQSIASGDFQGRSGCHAPHKIVQFALPADKALLIQLSGAADAHLKLTVTRVDATP